MDDSVNENSVNAKYIVPVLGQRRAFIKAKKFQCNGYSIDSDCRKVKETNDFVVTKLENVSRNVLLGFCYYCSLQLSCH